MSEINPLDSMGICAIIKSGKENNVSKIVFTDLIIEYFDNNQGCCNKTPSLNNSMANEDVKEVDLKNVRPDGKPTIEQQVLENIVAKELEVEELLISDPQEYERLIIEGELGNESTRDNDSFK